MTTMTAKTMNITETAEYLGFKKRVFYLMIADGRFPVRPITGLQPRRWNIEDVDAWRFANSEVEA